MMTNFLLSSNNRIVAVFFLLLTGLFGAQVSGQVLQRPLQAVAAKDMKTGVLTLKSSKEKETFHLFEDDVPKMKDCVIEFDARPLNSESKFGVIVRHRGEQDWVYIGCDLTSDILCYSHWFVSTPKDKKQITKDIAKFYKDYRRHVRVECYGQSVSIYIDGEKIAHCTVPIAGDHEGLIGFRAHGGAEVEISNIRYAALLSAKEHEVKPGSSTLSSEKLDVSFCDHFPVPALYRFKPSGETIKGARVSTHSFVVNGQMYPAETTVSPGADKIIYKSYLPDIKVGITTQYTVEGNKLCMEITAIEERGDFRVGTIGFPHHDLVTMDNDLPVGRLSVANNVFNDEFYKLSDRKNDETSMYGSIAILDNGKCAVTIDNNSIYNGKQVCFRTSRQEGDSGYTSLFSNEWIYRGITGETLPLPRQSVIFTGDENGDGAVDWQDGAIALSREYPEPYGADQIRNSYASIAMNFASCAQYPFLRILDNVKKFYLATDGFGQMIELKGYQSEGHDSGHPDYAGNYNNRAGGLRDLKILTEKAAAYNASIGVHINQSESYPEAHAYDREIITDIPGWSWLDQAQLINKERDVMRGTFEKRLKDLKNDLPHLGFIYIDTYREHRYLANKTARIFNEHGWSIWTEDSDIFFREGVWIHHPGKTQSMISRFVNHRFRDGYSRHPLLLGGYSRSADIGFMGWQKGRDFNNVIHRFFTEQLPYRFLMKHSLMKLDEEKAGFSGDVETFLKGEQHHISLEGNEIKRGNVVFIPWRSSDDKEKIYHYNPDGGTTTWTLPGSWRDRKTLKLYLLDDSGRHFKQELAVDQNHQVNIDAQPKQGYVLYRHDAPAQPAVAWGEGGPVVNPGFDGGLAGWKSVEGKPVIEKTPYGQSLLRLAEKGTAAQDISLPPGEYSVSVWCQVSGEGEARLSFGNESYCIRESTVKNFTDNSDRYNTFFQRIKLPVTHKGGKVALKLSFLADDDSSFADFDDVRIVAQKKRTVTNNRYFEDFEDVDEGWGPFIAARPSAYKTHLSEFHSGYTNDTIEGRYSLKTWKEGNGEVYRTSPAILRFKPEHEYAMRFLYKATNDGVYRVVVRSKKDDREVLNEILNGEGTFNGQFTTGKAADYYVVITKNGDGMFVMDNFMIEGEPDR